MMSVQQLWLADNEAALTHVPLKIHAVQLQFVLYQTIGQLANVHLELKEIHSVVVIKSKRANAILMSSALIIELVYSINVLILAKAKDLVAGVQLVRPFHIDQCASVLQIGEETLMWSASNMNVLLTMTVL